MNKSDSVNICEFVKETGN